MFPSVLTLPNKETKKDSPKKQNKEEEKKVKDDFCFSFGAGLDYVDENIDSDDFSSDESKEEEDKNDQNAKNLIEKIQSKNDKEIEFNSNMSDMFLADSFESTYSEPLLLSEEYVITLLSELYNRTFTKQTIMFLLSVAKDLLSLPQPLHIISMIMFSITFSLSDFTWMSPIIQSNFDPLYILTALDHYTELMNSGDENDPFNKELKKKEENEKLKKNANNNKSLNSSSHHLIKSNSMGSLNIFPRVTSSPTSIAPLKSSMQKSSNFRINSLNRDKSDELFNAVDTDNSSSTSQTNSEDEEENEERFISSHQLNQHQHHHSNSTNDDNLPNFFSVICPNVVPTRGDKELACFIAFDRMLTVLNELLTNSNPTIFTSFLHHRHRLMYRKIKQFRFSQQEIIRDLDAAGLKCQVIDRMRHTRESREWAISLTDKFTSPFFTTTKNNNMNNAPNYSFQYTSSYNIKTPSSRVYEVCINPFNNQQIAIASKQVLLLNSINPILLRDSSYSIAEHELKRNDIDGLIFNSSMNDKASFSSSDPSTKEEFKSPLLSFLTQQKIAKWEKVTQGLMLTRTYNNKWPKANGQIAKNIKATCIASQPTRESFVSGDNYGHLHYWKFGDQKTSTTNSMCATNAVKFFRGDYKIRSVKFNKAGDRICSIDSNARVAVSDFIGFQSFNLDSQYSSIGWLNNDNQFVVCSNTNIDLTKQIKDTNSIPPKSVHPQNKSKR